MSAQMLEVFLLGVGKVLRLESDAWSMVKRLRQAANEYAPPPAAARPLIYIIVGLGWHGRRKTSYVYWGWHWLATTL